jgi:inosose dehydratase
MGTNAAVKLGVAPDSWGVWFADDPRQTPWTRYLDEVAQTGVAWTELGPYGYMPTDPAELERELSSRGLSLAAGAAMFDLEDSDSWERMRQEVTDACALLQALGAEYLLLIDDVYTDLFTGEPRLAPTLSDVEWGRLVATSLRVCDIAGRHGLQVAFHPHAQCHVEYEQQIERLLADADGLSLCLDVGHHAYSGGDPVEFYRRHAARIPYLHLKSVDAELRERVRDQGLPFATAVAEGVFVEPSLGAVDFVGLRDAMAESGYDGFAVVEQDMYPTAFERPLPIAQRTIEHLAGLGLR